jgi:hypothetical protein
LVSRFAQDVSASYNIDAEAELTSQMLSEQVAAEIDRETLEISVKLLHGNSDGIIMDGEKLQLQPTHTRKKEW